MKEQKPPLPVKNGVSPNCIWLPSGNWKTVFDYFLEQFPHLKPSECSKRFQRKEVVTADGQFLTNNSPYVSGQHLYFYRELENELAIPFEEKIIYEDENILVADKPHFLPVAPTGQYLHETLLVRLRKKLQNDSLELCHRLDRETAGIVLLTKKQAIRAEYHALFSDRKITKIYHALAPTVNLKFPIQRSTRLVKAEPFFRMKETDGPANSETHINRLENRGANSLYQLSPISGKKHQLRVHLAGLNIPIVNDCFYPVLLEKKPDDYSFPLQLLAKSIQFIDPLSNQCRYFESDFSL